jgi:hypothetical protein
MLHYEVLHPVALGLLKRLTADPLLADYRLVGGTALALQIGHRTSDDLDFFNGDGRECGDWSDTLSSYGKTILDQASPHVHVYDIGGIKVDVVSVKSEWLEPPLVEGGLRLGSVLDIAAMKLSAITNRGTRKDFVDLAFLLEHFSLNDMMDAYLRRYCAGMPFLVFKSLSFFDDADNEPMPRMIIDRDWGQIKQTVANAVRTARIIG